jgi:hypothetical protein
MKARSCLYCATNNVKDIRIDSNQLISVWAKRQYIWLCVRHSTDLVNDINQQLQVLQNATNEISVRWKMRNVRESNQTRRTNRLPR